MPDDKNISILKTIWTRRAGRWAIQDGKSFTLKPKSGFSEEFFQCENKLELLTSRPPQGIQGFLSSFGQTDFLLQQSIVPVVAIVSGENKIRCIGTGFIISCSGYVMTACHVVTDPVDAGYGSIRREGNHLIAEDVSIGAMIPVNPASGASGFRFFPFQQIYYWGNWKSSPLVHVDETFEMLTDIAICKIAELPDGAAHQPLPLSLNSFKIGEKAFAIGYARMEDIPILTREKRIGTESFKSDIFVSVGAVMNVFPENHLRRDVPPPGPCFDFSAEIPGKMSGGPIFGADGAVVRGLVSRSFSGERHAFGAMIGPTMHLPLENDLTLKEMMDRGTEGITKMLGQGL